MLDTTTREIRYHTDDASKLISKIPLETLTQLTICSSNAVSKLQYLEKYWDFRPKINAQSEILAFRNIVQNSKVRVLSAMDLLTITSSGVHYNYTLRAKVLEKIEDLRKRLAKISYNDPQNWCSEEFIVMAGALADLVNIRQILLEISSC